MVDKLRMRTIANKLQKIEDKDDDIINNKAWLKLKSEQDELFKNLEIENTRKINKYKLKKKDL